jgi:hypothetical protein
MNKLTINRSEKIERVQQKFNFLRVADFVGLGVRDSGIYHTGIFVLFFFNFIKSVFKVLNVRRRKYFSAKLNVYI